MERVTLRIVDLGVSRKLDLRRLQDRIVRHEDFAPWNIDPLRWLAE